ncbi:MAG: M14 family metallopeptidase, partial [Balneolaceae bacterium]|nr:M14 family metallopeptidase [Balneolaceae bacterium]
MNLTVQRYLLAFVAVLCAGCSASKEFQGFSYDPPGATVTTAKEIVPQHRRTIGVRETGVWVTNEFKGARLSDFYRVNDSLYRAVIRPENAPINNSPWYGFKAWSENPRQVWIELEYEEGEHRYYPDISRDGRSWSPIDSAAYRSDTLAGTAKLRLNLSSDTLWVGAQEIIGQNIYDWWASNLGEYPFVRRDTVGFSHQGRPIEKMSITQASDGQKRGVVLITSRLHPPEIPGQMACFAFLERITAFSELATLFRNQFEVIAFPFANPDGADNGHWRHNAGGVDLNRDWTDFNQPETRAIRDYLLREVKTDSLRTVYYGIDFHSTDENIFYPINRSIDTFPDDFSFALIDSIQTAFPEVDFAVEPFDTSSPITKNWIFRTFGADALTYEVN